SALPQNSDEAEQHKAALYPSCLLCLAAFVSAAFTYHSLFPSLLNTICIIICAALWAGVFIILLRRRAEKKGRAFFALLCIFLSLCAAASAHIRASDRISHRNIPVTGKAFTARVDSRTPGRYTDLLILAVAPVDQGRAFTAVSRVSHDLDLSENDIFAFTGEPEPLKGNYSAAQMREGIFYGVKLYESNISIISRGNTLLRTKARDALIFRNSSLYGEKTGGVINALMLGDSAFVDKMTTYDFTRAGVLHILAASGMHVAVIAAIPLFLLSLCGLPKALSFSVTSVILAAYYYLTCMPVSLLRACVMFWILTAGILMRREKIVINALYLSAAVIVCICPWELYSLGFQLSYGATWGILLFQKQIFRVIPRIRLGISDSVALTLSAQLFVLPLLLASLNELNFTGLMSNIILVPGTTAGFFAAIGTDIVSIVWPAGGYAAAGAVSYFFELNLRAAHFFAQLPGHFSSVDAPWRLIIPYLMMWIPVCIKKIPRAAGTAALCAGIILSFVPLTLARNTPESEIALISSGGKNAVFYAGKKAFLYGGVRTAEEKNAAGSFAKEKGYCTVSVYINDFSPGSLRETAAFIRSNPVENVIIADGFPLDRRSSTLFDAVDRDGIKPVFIREAKAKSDCQYAQEIYYMKCRCESALSVKKTGEKGFRTLLRPVQI
ncbi:MAG: ComEC/Rec2 family competence protein, partial [Spirochaetota bacterium]